MKRSQLIENSYAREKQPHIPSQRENGLGTEVEELGIEGGIWYITCTDKVHI